MFSHILLFFLFLEILYIHNFPCLEDFRKCSPFLMAEFQMSFNFAYTPRIFILNFPSHFIPGHMTFLLTHAWLRIQQQRGSPMHISGAPPSHSSIVPGSLSHKLNHFHFSDFRAQIHQLCQASMICVDTNTALWFEKCF